MQTQFYLKVASIIQSFFVSRVIEVTCFLCSTCNRLVITVDKSWVWIDTCCMCGAIKVIICAQVVMLVLAWKLDAQSMGYFTRQEWLRGMGSLQYVTSLIFCHFACCFLSLSSPCFSRMPFIFCRAEYQSMSKTLFCFCQVRLHREAEELARLSEICPKRQHQF